MFFVLFALFVLVPTIEISLFVEVGDEIGVWPTIGLTFLTAGLGAFLVRSQGLQTLMVAQERLRQGEVPTQQFVEGVLLIFSGVLLFIPGFMTDTIGIILLIPFTRHLIAQRLMSRMADIAQKRAQFDPYGQNSSNYSGSPPEGKVFEGEFERKEKDQDRLH